MVYTKERPGALAGATRAENVSFGRATCSPLNPLTLRHQHLIAHHGIAAALAPLIAALAWTGGRL